MSDAAFQIGILEDDDNMRAYLKHILDDVPTLQIAFSEATLSAARQAMKSLDRIDLCLVDLQLPDGNGAEFVKDLLPKDCKALILTVLGDRMSVLAALEAGADGYLLKDTAPKQIIRHIDDTLKGANPISSQAATHLLRIFKDQKSATDDNPKSTLTPRETEILTLFAKGLSYKEAAETLEISPYTVSDYVKSIYSKLSVNSRNEAVFEALQLGWIDI